MRCDNYIVIQGWMIKEYGLSGNDLLVYAIVYGVTQDDSQTYKNSLSYMMDCLGCTKATVISSLKRLVLRGLLEKFESEDKGIKRCEYRTTRGGGIKIIPPGIKIIPPPIFDTSINNINSNITNNNNVNDIDNLRENRNIINYIKKDNKKETNTKKKETKEKIENNQSYLLFEAEATPKNNDLDFATFWALYDKKVGDKEKLCRKWENLPMGIKRAILDYIPRYKEAQPDKQYRKNPETFLNNRSWEDEIIKKDNGTIKGRFGNTSPNDFEGKGYTEL